jgi:hypothetical protein
MRDRNRPSLASLVVVAAAAAACPAWAQSPPDPSGMPAAAGPAEDHAPAARPEMQTAPGPGDPSRILGATPEPSSSAVDRIKEEGIAVVTGTHWSYDPAGRRDPFRSLVENVAIKGDVERPKGIAGMLIAEVDLVGIVDSPKGAIAFLNGTDNRGYFLHEGDALFDGTVQDIDRSAGRVVFRQRVDDPREIKPYREVIKKLNVSTEDGQ